MNRAMLKEYDIAYMVTKESGLAGGYPQKCQAALEAGVKMVVIGRPEEEEGMNFEEMSKFLQKELELDNHWKVTLWESVQVPETRLHWKQKDVVRKQNF